jgi:uncharacterized membrane protein YjgN (DUF898 family)
MDQITTLAPPPPPLQPAVPPALPPTGTPVAFTGDRRSFFGLVMRGAGLEMITAGFYRFWLTTDIRRHLWSHTVVDGDGAEYTGRGKELFIGFLIAMAILVPIYIGYFALGVIAEETQAFASVPLVALFYLFTQFAIYRARRYRMTRTIWRGVRFWMTGSGWNYALRASLWGLAMIFTLGLVLPWRDAALERYKMQHTHYGELQGSFEGKGSDFFKQAWWLWLLSPTIVLGFPIPFIYGAFKAIQLRWWLNGLRLGGVRLSSNLDGASFIGLYWKTIGWSILLSMVFSIYVGVVTAVVASISGEGFETAFANSDMAVLIPYFVLLGIDYLGWALLMGAIARVYLMRDLWERAVTSITVHGIEAAANVAAKGELANAIGEGFADGLDVGGL